MFVHQIEAGAGFVFRQPLVQHFGIDAVGDAAACRACAKANVNLVGKFFFADGKCAQDACEGDDACALDVVVEGGDAVLVGVQHVGGVAAPEVFPMQIGLVEHALGGVHKGIDKLVIRFAAQAFLAVAQIERIIQQGLAVGADI